MRLSFTRIYFVSRGSFWDRKFSANCWMSNISETNNFVKGIHSDCQVDRYGILNKGLWGNLGFYNLVITTSKEHVQSWSHGSVLMIYVYIIASKRIKQGWRPKCPTHPNPGYGTCSENHTGEKFWDVWKQVSKWSWDHQPLSNKPRKEKIESACPILQEYSRGCMSYMSLWFIFILWEKFWDEKKLTLRSKFFGWKELGFHDGAAYTRRIYIYIYIYKIYMDVRVWFYFW